MSVGHVGSDETHSHETSAAAAAITLDDGLRLVVTPVEHARSVAISVYVAAGARYEVAPEDAGLSHFVEHLCFKGTERWPRPHDIAAEIDSIGGTTNAATEQELTVYYAKATTEHAPRAITLLADILQNSLFHDAEIERERGVILEELASVEDSPDELVGIVLDGLIWPDLQLGRDIAGTPESVTAIAPERLREYYRTQYVPSSVVVSVAGAVTVEEATGLVSEAFDGWEAGEPADWVRAGDAARGDRLRVISKETEQAHLSLGMRGLSSVDDDRYALGMLSIILGEGMSSRLFTRLREELGLCYDVHTFLSHLRDVGNFGVGAGVDPSNAVAAVREVCSELRRVREPVSAEELDRAKSVVRSRIQLQMEDTRAVSAWYGARVALGLPLRTPEELTACFERTTIEDLVRVANRVIRDDNLHLAVVGTIERPDELASALAVGV